MTKEMYVSSTPHETKVAVVEDDQLAEVFFERENEYTLAGSIYKGRVTRVLPGMQSAFVDIGLERDAFLYVSDFLDLAGEEEEEFDSVPTRPEAYVTNRPQPEPRSYEFQREFHKPEPAQQHQPQQARTSEPEETVDEGYAELTESSENGTEGGEDNGRFRGRRRRRGRRGRGFPESKFARGPQREETAPELEIAEDFGPPAGYEPVLLPGESISKYRRPERAERMSSSADLDETEVEPGAELSPSQSGGEASFVIEGGFDAPGALTEFAEPEGPAKPEFAAETLNTPEPERARPVPAPVPTPFVLPGESIAKYKPASREGLEEKVAEEANQAPAPELAAPPEPVIATETDEKEPVAPKSVPPFTYTGPIILPGEKIAKYQPKATVAEAVENDQQLESAAEISGEAAGSVSEEPTEPEGGKASASEEPAPERRRKRQEGPRTEVRMERRNPVAPFVLPGESIAKYRRATDNAATGNAATGTVEQESSEHGASEVSGTLVEESIDVSEATAATETGPAGLEPGAASEGEQLPEVAEHGSIGGIVEPAPEAEKSAEQPETKYEEMNVAATFGGEAAELPREEVEVPGCEAEPEESGEPVQENEDQARFEELNVASTFAGDAAESEAEHAAYFGEGAGEESQEDAHEERASGDDYEPGHAYETMEQRHRYSAEAGHTLEQEEIEEDESDYEVLPEEEDESDFVELEEQTLQAGDEETGVRGIVGGNEIDEANGLTDAVVDALLDEETSASAYPEETLIDEHGVEIEPSGDVDDEDEFEESELEAEIEEPAAAQGQVVASAYPQRPARPGYDRRPGRGRRGGRRMRGGPRREAPRAIPQISDLLKEGQEVLIQIAKEPIGKKGARITSHIALPGRYLVYMPTVNHIGVSRKINSDEERQRLKRIMLSEREGGHGGFIVRTAAEGITEEELRADIRFLKNLWHDIKTRSDNSKAPALIYHDLNLVERVLRDQVTADFSSIWVDNEAEYERVLRFAQRFQSQLVRKVKLYTKSTPLYEQFGIQEEINKALKSKVWLKSGGYIVINQTEALVAIDVNTGKYVGKTTRLEDTIVKTNIDAIKEIVRQIRLRDLGGIIVIDFIDMDERKNRQKVMQALEEAMKADRAPSKVLAFNDFGLVAITRKRVKQSLERTLGEPCSYCTGTGLVKSMNTMCNEIFVEMRKMAPQLSTGDVILRVNPEVGKALKANGGKWILEMEELTRKTILVKPDALLHQENFDIQG